MTNDERMNALGEKLVKLCQDSKEPLEICWTASIYLTYQAMQALVDEAEAQRWFDHIRVFVRQSNQRRTD